MKWKIISDSSADIQSFNASFSEIGFERVPFTLNIDDHIYLDNNALSTEEIINIFSHTQKHSSTACPSPQAYLDAFSGADNIICFTISKNISGSFNSATLAKNIHLEESPDTSIYIVDSKSSSSEVNLLIRKCLELIQQGLAFDAVIQKLEEYHQHTHVNFLLNSVENLVMNGRVNKFIGQMIGMLNIRLIGKRTEDGRIELATKSKGRKRSHEALLKAMLGNGFNGNRIEIAHAHNEKEAQQFLDFILNKYPKIHHTIIETSGLNAYYAEKSGLIVGYETNIK